MQEAIPYKSRASFPTNYTNHTVAPPRKEDDLKKLVAQNPVIIFGKRGCCMIHVINRLLQGQGANPAVYEIDEKDENDVVSQIQVIGNEEMKLPAVFIGGRFFGGLDRIMGAHISGELIPVLKEARALWL